MNECLANWWLDGGRGVVSDILLIKASERWTRLTTEAILLIPLWASGFCRNLQLQLPVYDSVSPWALFFHLSVGYNEDQIHRWTKFLFRSEQNSCTGAYSPIKHKISQLWRFPRSQSGKRFPSPPTRPATHKIRQSIYTLVHLVDSLAMGRTKMCAFENNPGRAIFGNCISDHGLKWATRKVAETQNWQSPIS